MSPSLCQSPGSHLANQLEDAILTPPNGQATVCRPWCVGTNGVVRHSVPQGIGLGQRRLLGEGGEFQVPPRSRLPGPQTIQESDCSRGPGSHGVHSRRHPGSTGEPDCRGVQEVQAEAAFSAPARRLWAHPAGAPAVHGRHGPHRQAGLFLSGRVRRRAHGACAARHWHERAIRAAAADHAQRPGSRTCWDPGFSPEGSQASNALCGPAPDGPYHTGHRCGRGAGCPVRKGPDRGAVPGSASRAHQCTEDEETLQLHSSLERDLQRSAPSGSEGHPALPGA